MSSKNITCDTLYFDLLCFCMNLLSTNEAAEKLNLSPIRIRQLIQSGRLPADKVGRDYVIKESDLKLVADRPTGRPPKEKKTNA